MGNENHGIVPAGAINEAQLLLEYAAQKGLAVDGQIVSDIIQAKHAAATDGQWNKDIETAFWRAYDLISKAVQPVSVHSLRALGKVYEGGFPFLRKFLKSPRVSDADKLVTYYRAMTVILLAVLLTAQIVFSYGTAVVNELIELPDKIAQIKSEMAKAASADKRPADANVAAQKHATETGNPAAADENAAASEENSQFRETIILKEKLASLNWKYLASSKILAKWFSIISFGTKDTQETTAPQDRKEQFQKGTTGMTMMLQDAIFILKMMQSYFLPLLYGFVGACAHILRSLSAGIRDVTYTRESRVLYLARLLLGGLSGLAIGWFISPDTDSAIKTISPFAIAFVAGYGVEMLFSIMDKIVGAFSNEKA